MIPQSCPLSDKGKLHVTLHVECVFIREGQEPFNEMCKDCSFNPAVIKAKKMNSTTPMDYETLLNYYTNILGYSTGKEIKLLKEIEEIYKQEIGRGWK